MVCPTWNRGPPKDTRTTDVQHNSTLDIIHLSARSAWGFCRTSAVQGSESWRPQRYNDDPYCAACLVKKLDTLSCASLERPCQRISPSWGKFRQNEHEGAASTNL
eukprot:3425829-Alexandrium_andersonii.AAC.1